jgi:hypothetical protein
MSKLYASTLAVAVSLLTAGAVQAQEIEPQGYKQVVSANPFGLLLEFFNAEYERVISASSSIGIGGSTVSDDSTRYFNADVFWRFYPSGRALEGWTFGMKVGVTRVPEIGTYPGYGFDVNRSWLAGPKKNFYVGIGFGLKRLIGAPDNAFGWEYVPTLRIINVGYAF